MLNLIDKILPWIAILAVVNAAVYFAVVSHNYALFLCYAVIAVFLLLDRKGKKKDN